MDPIKYFITTLLAVLLVCQRQQADADCYGLVTNINLGSILDASFTSPRYPYTYSNNEECSWLITAPVGQRVLLYFTSFDLEDESTCIYDSVKVYDGYSVGDSLLAKRCGSEIPPPVYSSGRKLLVNFTSDSSIIGKGFAANVSTLSSRSTACPANVNSSSVGVIYSPGFPWSYPNNKVCRWYISAPYRTKINLTFTKVHLQSNWLSCSRDYVKVEGRYGAYIDKLCGQKDYMYSIVSSSNFLLIEFHTNSSVSSTGFMAYYQYTTHFLTTPYPWWTTRPYPWGTTYPWWTTEHVASYSCNFNSINVLDVESTAMIASPGYPGRLPRRYYTNQYKPTCTWKVKTKDSDYLELTFDVMSIERCDSYCNCGRVTVGEYGSANLGQFCMGRASSTVKSKGETMYIKYYASERSDTFKATIRAKKTKISVPGIVIPVVAAVILFGIIFVIVGCVRPIPSTAQPGSNITEAQLEAFPPASQNVASAPPDPPTYPQGVINVVADNNA